jgi:hypothetical protein
MALSVLTELNDELSRLYVAGSALAAGESRLARLALGLRMLGKKAPVFAELDDRLAVLLVSDTQHSPEALMEAGLLLHSLRYTQGITELEEAAANLVYAETPLAPTVIPFSRLKVVSDIMARRVYEPAILAWVQELHAMGQHNDPRLYRAYCKVIADKGELTEFLEHTIIPAIGKPMIPFVEAQLDITGGSRNAALFRILYALKGPDILPLSEEALERGAVWVACEAIISLAEEPRYKEQLLTLAQDRRNLIKKAALRALNTMKMKELTDVFPKVRDATLTTLDTMEKK